MADKKSRTNARATANGAKSPAPRNGLRAIRGLKIGEASAEFDKIIHERARLAIVSSLAVNAKLSFNELKDLCAISDGNLSVHARKLEEAGYVKCTKAFEGRVPKTVFELTAAGRRSLERYLAHMDDLIRTVRGP